MTPLCPQTDRGDDAAFLDRFSDKLEGRRIPFSGGIALTNRCNLRCPHCYAREDGPAGRELSAPRWKSILDELKEAGCLFLLFTGGDPLIREDFADLYAYTRRSGFLVTLFSNGTLITEETAALLADLPPRAVEISLFSATPEVHDRIAGVPGAFARSLRAVEALTGRGIPVKLKAVLMTLNAGEIPGLEALAGRLGLPFRFDAAIFPAFNGDPSPRELRVAVEQAVAQEVFDAKRVTEWREFIGRLGAPPAAETLYSCSAGMTLFHIDPDGTLRPCVMTRAIGFDLDQGSFREGWGEVLPRLLGRAGAPPDACRSCRYRPVCDYCPGFFELENGDSHRPSEFLCALGKRRYEELGLGDFGIRVGEGEEQGYETNAAQYR